MIAETTQDERDAHARRQAKCSSCGAAIVWLKTARGKNMPTNAGTVSAIDTLYDARIHMSHFATCEKAAQHRKPRK